MVLKKIYSYNNVLVGSAMTEFLCSANKRNRLQIINREHHKTICDSIVVNGDQLEYKDTGLAVRS